MIIERLRRAGTRHVTNREYYGWMTTKTFSLGDGMWSLEVYDAYGDFLTEFVGSNGTRYDEEADDLYAAFDEWRNEVHHSCKLYEAPDGTIAPFSFFAGEAKRGYFHGCMVGF